MRDEKRITPLMEKMARVWETQFPDYRFIQFVNMIAGEVFQAEKQGGGRVSPDPFFWEDDVFDHALDSLIEKEQLKNLPF